MENVTSINQEQYSISQEKQEPQCFIKKTQGREEKMHETSEGKSIKPASDLPYVHVASSLNYFLYGNECRSLIVNTQIQSCRHL